MKNADPTGLELAGRFMAIDFVLQNKFEEITKEAMSAGLKRGQDGHGVAGGIEEWKRVMRERGLGVFVDDYEKRKEEGERLRASGVDLFDRGFPKDPGNTP